MAQAAEVEGVHDHAVASAAYETMRCAGSDFMCIEPIVAAGYRSGLAHCTVAHIPIQHDESVFIELGACVRRCSAPIMRTTVVGPTPSARQELMDAALLAVWTIVETTRAGVPTSEVVAAAHQEAM